MVLEDDVNPRMFHVEHSFICYPTRCPSTKPGAPSSARSLRLRWASGEARPLPPMLFPQRVFHVEHSYPPSSQMFVISTGGAFFAPPWRDPCILSGTARLYRQKPYTEDSLILPIAGMFHVEHSDRPSVSRLHKSTPQHLKRSTALNSSTTHRSPPMFHVEHSPPHLLG
jgi:hypothetical protein